MEVIAYLHNADLLVQDEGRLAVISGSHYVLSLGDQVYFQQDIDQQGKVYPVKISFAGIEHSGLHDDEVQLKFEGGQDSYQHYIRNRTVH